jgi:hypothetical protein
MAGSKVGVRVTSTVNLEEMNNPLEGRKGWTRNIIRKG